MLILSPLKKLQKTHVKKVIIKKVLDIYFCVQKFLAYNFFVWFFCTFFNRFELVIKFCVLWYSFPIMYKKFFWLKLALFQTFKAKIVQKG